MQRVQVVVLVVARLGGRPVVGGGGGDHGVGGGGHGQGALVDHLFVEGEGGPWGGGEVKTNARTVDAEDAFTLVNFCFFFFHI